MKITMDTAKLNTILSSVEKGVGAVRVLPITDFLHITLKKGVLSIVATDSMNFVTYTEKGFEGEDGEAIVKADQLIKLAAKTTKKEMTLELKGTEDNQYLEVKGNGTYKVELNTEDKFPTYTFNEKVAATEVDLKVLREIFTVNSSAIATDMIMPCLTGYNIGGKSTTTDGVKMCINNTKVLDGEPVLITQQLAELVKNVKSDKIKVQVDGNKLLFSTSHLKIFGTELDDKEDFPDIEPLANLSMENSVTVKRIELLESLGRLSLFTDAYDNSAVVLTFNKGSLKIQDLKENSTETVKYVKKEIETKGTVTVSIIFLIRLLESLSKEEVELLYSMDEEEKPFMIRQDKVTQLLSTMEAEEDE